MHETDEPFLSHTEPVLPVRDVREAIGYWRNVLGFPHEWTWGDPPNVGGVSWHTAFVQFYLKEKFTEAHGGQYIWVRVKNIDSLYKLHKERGAQIVQEIAPTSYGFRDYIVKDINGHYIVFAAPAPKKRSPESVARNISVVVRKPTLAEYRRLGQSVGWTHPATDERLQMMLDSQLAGFVAEDAATGQAIGCALLAGDGLSFFYVKDVMVYPDWQNRKVGARVMRALSDWLDIHAPESAFVNLFTSETLAPFYSQFDFRPGFGMVRTIPKKTSP